MADQSLCAVGLNIALWISRPLHTKYRMGGAGTHPSLTHILNRRAVHAVSARG